MRKIWAITKREYIERVRTRWFLISTVFGPLIFGSLMILPNWLASRNRPSETLASITILDVTRTGLGRRVATALSGGAMGDTSRTRVQTLERPALAEAESLATRAVIRRESKGYLVLDSTTMAGIRFRYAGTNATAFADMQELRRHVREQVMAMRLEHAGVNPMDVMALANMRLELDAERITATGRGGSGQVSVIFALVVAVMLYMSIFIYGQNVLRGVMEEKLSRVAEVIVSSVPATSLLTGKVLGVGAVGLTQLSIWGIASALIYELRSPLLAALGASQLPLRLPPISPGMALLLLLFFLLGYTLYASLFAAVGAMVNSEQDAQQAQMPIVLLLVMSIIFLQPIIGSPESPLALAMSMLPFSAPIIMPLRLSAAPVPAWEVAASILTLLIGCAVAVAVAARIYRIGLLMYGKRPSMRELGRWVREAS